MASGAKTRTIIFFAMHFSIMQVHMTQTQEIEAILMSACILLSLKLEHETGWLRWSNPSKNCSIAVALIAQLPQQHSTRTIQPPYHSLCSIEAAEQWSHHSHHIIATVAMQHSCHSKETLAQMVQHCVAIAQSVKSSLSRRLRLGDT